LSSYLTEKHAETINNNNTPAKLTLYRMVMPIGTPFLKEKKIIINQ